MDNLKDILKEIGLNDYECKTYRFLLNAPRSTAPTVARGSMIPTSKIYTVLERLIAKGFAVVELGKPKKFSAIDPDIVIKALFSSKREYLDDLERRLSEVASKVDIRGSDTGIWIVKGRDTVEALIDNVVRSAEKNLMVRCSSDKLYLKNIVSGLKDVVIDFKSNPVGNNMVNSDGKEMVMYLNKKEAIWIKDRKYCKHVKDPTMSIDRIFPLQKYL